MAAPLNYFGQIAEQGGDCTVKVEVTFRTKAEAKTFGEWLHAAIAAHITGHGGSLKAVVPKKQILQNGQTVFLPPGTSIRA